METVDHLCAAVASWLTLAMPLCFLIWLTVRFRDTSPTTLFGVAGDFAAIKLIITWRAWYAKPDLAHSPVAAVSSAAIVTVPALFGLAYVYLLCTRSQRSAWVRALYSLGTGYLVMGLCLFPATLVFVQLGGDSL